MTMFNEFSNELRLNKQQAQNSTKLANFILLLFNPTNSNKLVDNYFCSRIYKRLEILVKQDRKNHTEYFNNYFKLWIDILIIKNWHKYKNLVKCIDFLIKYLFYYENSQVNRPDSDHTHLIHQSITLHLIDKLIYYVKSDFGILNNSLIANSNTSNLNADNIENNESDNASINSSSNSPTVNLNSQSSSTNTGSNGMVSMVGSSFSWLTSSLTYVVTTTTSQIGNNFYLFIEKIILN